jgi:lipoyl(octanoyl) transferase
LSKCLDIDNNKKSGLASGFRLLELGMVSYTEALELQLELHAKVRAGELWGALILLEHYPVITVGASAKPENVLVSEDALRANGIELVQTDRGGDATYHGPGQLVGYPIINLRAIGSDVHRFLRLIEGVVISAIADFGVDAGRNGPAGVWVGDKKVCSIGIAIRGGVTYHGFALNVNPNMQHFSFINPCGLQSQQITSLESLLKPAPEMPTVRARIVEHFKQSLGLLED